MALLGLFKRKVAPADFSRLKTDIHSHFLPGLDDGAKTLADSLELLMAMESLGYTKVITTPHVMSDAYRNSPEIITSALANVKDALTRTTINLEIEAAAEYYLDFEFAKKIKEEKILTFGGKRKYLLWEISFMNPPDNMYEIVFEMQTQGYKPVLAHVERYSYWHRNYSKYEELAAKGILLQMNINSLTGYYSAETKKAAQWLIDKNMISFLGSDCHHLGHIKLLKQAQTEKYLNKVLDSGKLLNSTL